jgi:hypothetical protein
MTTNIREHMTILHTNPTAALARRDRLTPEDLRLAEDARELWRTITDDKTVMKRITAGPMKWVIYRLRKTAERSCPVELLGRIIVWLANAGITEAKLRLIPQFFARVIDDCFAGSSHRSLTEIDVEEQRLESIENAQTIHRLTSSIDILSAEQLETEARPMSRRPPSAPSAPVSCAGARGRSAVVSSSPARWWPHADGDPLHRL